MRAGPSRIRQAYAVGCLLLLGVALLFAGSIYALVTRPIASEAQIQAARARVEQGRNQMPTSCPRPVLRGVALPRDGGEGFGDLARAEEPYLRCLEHIQRYAFRARHVIEAPLTAELQPFERVALVECAAFDTAVQALLQRGSGCSSGRLFRGYGGMPDIQRLGSAMFLLARARIRDGHLQEGMELLLDMIRLGQDATRGHVSFEEAHLGLQLQADAADQLEAMLATDLPWTRAMLDEFGRQARVLADTSPDPVAWLEQDAFWVRLHALDQLAGPAAEEHRDQALVAIAMADYGGARWPDCTGLAPQACDTRYRDEIRATSAEGVRLWEISFVPGVERERRILGAYLERLNTRQRMIVAASINEARLRALPALFLHRRMALSGICPSAEALQTEALAAGIAGGFEIASSSEPLRPIHLRLRMPYAPEPLFRAFCQPSARHEQGRTPTHQP